MPAPPPPYIRLPCFLLLAALAAPFLLAGLVGTSGGLGSHNGQAILLLGLFIPAGIFVIFVLVSTWPDSRWDSRPENRKNFLHTRKGALAASAYLAVLVLIFLSFWASACARNQSYNRQVPTVSPTEE